MELRTFITSLCISLFLITAQSNGMAANPTATALLAIKNGNNILLQEALRTRPLLVNRQFGEEQKTLLMLNLDYLAEDIKKYPSMKLGGIVWGVLRYLYVDKWVSYGAGFVTGTAVGLIEPCLGLGVGLTTTKIVGIIRLISTLTHLGLDSYDTAKHLATKATFLQNMQQRLEAIDYIRTRNGFNPEVVDHRGRTASMYALSYARGPGSREIMEPIAHDLALIPVGPAIEPPPAYQP